MRSPVSGRRRRPEAGLFFYCPEGDRSPGRSSIKVRKDYQKFAITNKRVYNALWSKKFTVPGARGRLFYDRIARHMYLELQNIRKSYGIGETRTEVLKGISLEVEKGEICVLLGPSGSGKSTLLNIIGGIDSADSGAILIDGESLTHMTEKRLTAYRRKNLGYVFQAYNLIPNLTVEENIEVGAYLGTDPLDLEELIRVLGLTEHRHKLPSQLSGGQQQRTAIGRAVIKNPGILLCDEPTGALDTRTSLEILQLIENVNRRYQSAVVMVTHNEAIAGMADRIVRLRDGEIRSDRLNRDRVPAKELVL